MTDEEPGSTRWGALAGAPTGSAYARRFADLAATGTDVHGEASFCAAVVPPPAAVLDAGCGTGRVAIRLAELGYLCTGVDAEATMIAEARAAAPALAWVLADLAALGDALPGPYDLIVAAGNVVPLLAEGTEAAVITALAARLTRGGLLVAGFGLDAAHLPLAEAPFGLAEYDTWCAAAGLTLVSRYAGWDGAPYDPYDPHARGGYAVSVHRR